jgi:hypothetical protein
MPRDCLCCGTTLLAKEELDAGFCKSCADARVTPPRQWPNAFELSVLFCLLRTNGRTEEQTFDDALEIWNKADHYINEQKFTARKD